MLMKQISKFLVIVMAVALFVTGLPGGVVKAVAIEPSVPDSPPSIAFEDGDSQMNHYFGLVTIGRVPNESSENIQSYELYWANDSSILDPGNPFAVIPATDPDITYILDTTHIVTIPSGTTRLAAVSKNSSGVESAPNFIQLTDNIIGNITPSPSPTHNSVSIFNFPVDRAGTAYFDVVPYGVTPLTYGQLTTGGNATSVSIPVAIAGTISVSIPGLSAYTVYTLYMVTVDSSGHYSSIKTFDFKTLIHLDVNSDNAVGIDDIVNIIIGNSPMRDINNDGRFDQSDIIILLDHITPKVSLDLLDI